ncbi:unnamed protein product [Rotaria magnacalcarata]|uniref:CSD domain-containing protein n=1 Tax=Rotaria magnacalcarata TaxID=392030 RepID=A0A815W967_9BILA|nr:unnamed protein product [Rotaria magnacalcarata]CAF1539073.1 unnamed protein product [Rotaria magnacalcarata]CAF1945584.1 unnamed protein product [Rotaria magnacalcarata]CAF3884594.1 unnamed protein product [Rotaria magnacalcarata]CAF3890655.1 unnamed protein product [Rotaria magnacalcarata]
MSMETNNEFISSSSTIVAIATANVLSETANVTNETTNVTAETTNMATATANIPANTMHVSKTYKGTIVKYINQRHFGFIKFSTRETTTRKEIFFHKSNIIKNNFKPDIKEGNKCHFEISPGIKGDNATNIVINYRPISKIKKTNNTTDENNAQAALFTKTMLEFFRAAVTANK